jgi:hypothetical protein
VLLLAYNLTGDEKYLNEANNTLHSFLIDYDKGGVVSNEDDDGGIGDGDSSTSYIFWQNRV